MDIISMTKCLMTPTTLVPVSLPPFLPRTARELLYSQQSFTSKAAGCVGQALKGREGGGSGRVATCAPCVEKGLEILYVYIHICAVAKGRCSWTHGHSVRSLHG